MKDKDELVNDFKRLIREQSLTDETKELIIRRFDELIEAIIDEAFEDGKEHVREGLNW
jgi:hypothetical protein